MKDKITEKEMKMVLDGARTKIIASNKGMAVEGNLLEVVKITEILIHQLYESGISKKVLEKAFNNAIGKEEKEITAKERKPKEELRDLLKGLTEALTKDLENLEKILGDEENE